jgi:hypothetical protein
MSLLENLHSWCCLSSGLCCSYKVLITLAGSFIFSSFFIVWLCASVMYLIYFVVIKVKCNWYLQDINIFPLSKIGNVFHIFGRHLYEYSDHATRCLKQLLLTRAKLHDSSFPHLRVFLFPIHFQHFDSRWSIQYKDWHQLGFSRSIPCLSRVTLQLLFPYGIYWILRNSFA